MLEPCKDPLSLLVLHVPGKGGWHSRQTMLEGEIFLDFLQSFFMGRLHVADAQQVNSEKFNEPSQQKQLRSYIVDTDVFSKLKEIQGCYIEGRIFSTRSANIFVISFLIL